MRMLYCGGCKAVTDIKMVQSKRGAGKWVECIVCDRASSSFADNFDDAYAKWVEENPQPSEGNEMTPKPNDTEPVYETEPLNCIKAEWIESGEIENTLEEDFEGEKRKFHTSLEGKPVFQVGKRYCIKVYEVPDNGEN